VSYPDTGQRRHLPLGGDQELEDQVYDWAHAGGAGGGLTFVSKVIDFADAGLGTGVPLGYSAVAGDAVISSLSYLVLTSVFLPINCSAWIFPEGDTGWASNGTPKVSVQYPANAMGHCTLPGPFAGNIMVMTAPVRLMVAVALSANGAATPLTQGHGTIHAAIAKAG